MTLVSGFAIELLDVLFETALEDLAKEEIAAVVSGCEKVIIVKYIDKLKKKPLMWVLD